MAVTRDYAAASLGLNPNQLAVGTMLNGVADATGGDLVSVLNTLDNLPTGSAVADAYQHISPDKASALPTLSLAGSMMQWNALSNRLARRHRHPGSSPSSAGGGSGSFNLSYSQHEGLMPAYHGSNWGSFIDRPLPKPGDSGPWGIQMNAVTSSGSQES